MPVIYIYGPDFFKVLFLSKLIMHNFRLSFLFLVSVIGMNGCAPVVTAAAGVGGSAAMTYTLNGTAYRTFTAPVAKVRSATINALDRMKIKVVSEGRQDKNNGRLFTAKTNERNIEIHIEPISTNTTRMSVAAKSSPFLYDNATAEEILQQTKKSLG